MREGAGFRFARGILDTGANHFTEDLLNNSIKDLPYANYFKFVNYGRQASAENISSGDILRFKKSGAGKFHHIGIAYRSSDGKLYIAESSGYPGRKWKCINVDNGPPSCQLNCPDGPVACSECEDNRSTEYGVRIRRIVADVIRNSKHEMHLIKVEPLSWTGGFDADGSFTLFEQPCGELRVNGRWNLSMAPDFTSGLINFRNVVEEFSGCWGESRTHSFDIALERVGDELQGQWVLSFSCAPPCNKGSKKASVYVSLGLDGMPRGRINWSHSNDNLSGYALGNFFIEN